MVAFWPIGKAEVILIASFPIREKFRFWLLCMRSVKELYHNNHSPVGSSVVGGTVKKTKKKTINDYHTSIAYTQYKLQQFKSITRTGESCYYKLWSQRGFMSKRVNHRGGDY